MHRAFYFLTISMKKTNRGFTLIEILVVIGIIAVLAAIVIVAVNPARQFAQARNTQRESNVSTILNAVGQNMVDYKGVFTCASIVTAIPVAPTAALEIAGQAGVGRVDLSCLVPIYIASAMPVDPTNGTIADTQYTIQQDTVANGSRFIICAPQHDESAIVPAPGTYCLTR